MLRKRQFTGMLLAMLMAGTFLLLQCSEKKPALPAPILSSVMDGSILRISVEVPAGHHAYLDQGKEGNLIPVSFIWQGSGPEIINSPLGEFDQKVEATVLRGRGEWSFQKPAQSSVKVRWQICQEQAGLCYPPETKELDLSN